MALIKCKKCGKDISDTTDVCIHCGCPVDKLQETNTKKKSSKKLIIIVSIIVVLLLCFVLLVPAIMNKRIDASKDRSGVDFNSDTVENDDDSTSGFTRYSNTDYFYLPDSNKFVKGTSKVKSFEGKNFSNNLIFAGNGGCTRAYNSIKDFSKQVTKALNNPYNTLIYANDICGVDMNTLWKVSKYVAYDSSACFTNFNGKCDALDMDTYTYPMKVMVGPMYIFYKEAEVYYDTDDDGYGDALATGIYISSIKHFNENVGQLLSDGTVILNDSKTNNGDSNNSSDNNDNTGSNNTNTSSNTNNNTTGSNNTNTNSNTNNNATGSNNTNTSSNNKQDNSTVNNSTSNNNPPNQNNADNNQVDKPIKKQPYKLVFNNFDKYSKDNFGDNGFSSKSIITFYVDGECVTDTKVDDIELRPAGSYWIHSKELKGIVNFDLYIDGKKVDTISVNVDEKMQYSCIYID